MYILFILLIQILYLMIFLYFITYNSSNDITPQRLSKIKFITLFTVVIFLIMQFICHVVNEANYEQKIIEKEEYLRNNITEIITEINKNETINN